MRILFASLLLLAACQTSDDDRPQRVSVRYGAGAQTIAEQRCGGPVQVEQVQQDRNLIIYRCIREGF
jgi:hypothetical protein